jgi:hypothetical protein
MWASMGQAPTIFSSPQLKFILRLAVRVAANAFCVVMTRVQDVLNAPERHSIGHSGSRREALLATTCVFTG